MHSSVPDPAKLCRAALESDSTCEGAAVMEFCVLFVVREPPQARQVSFLLSCCSDALPAVIEDAGESHTNPRCPAQLRITCTGTADSQRAFRSSPTGETQKLTSARSASWIQTRTRVSFIPGAVYNVLVSRQNPDAMSDEVKLKGKHTKKWKSQRISRKNWVWVLQCWLLCLAVKISAFFKAISVQILSEWF